MKGWITLKSLFRDQKRAGLLTGAAVCILLLIAANGLGGKKAATDSVLSGSEDYVQQLQKQLEDILSQGAGVGKVAVMITLETGVESVYAQQYDQTESHSEASGQTTTKTESANTFVTVGSGSAQQPLELKQVQPKIRGVLVVCSGAGSDNVKLWITEAVSTLLDLSTNRIAVMQRQ